MGNEVQERVSLIYHILFQIANVGPIIYTIANRAAPNKVKEWPVIYVIISIGALACLLLTFLWSHTSFVLGQERSTALISLSSFLALVDTTSSVVFLPYMALFKAHYMSAFYIGEGLSGLIPGLVGLVQGIGTDPVCKNVTIVIHNSTTGQNTTEHKVEAVYPPPVFSVEVFFFFLFGLLVISCLAFSCLNFSAFARQEMVTIQDDKSSSSSGSVTFERALDEDEQINFLPGRSNKQRVNLDDIGKILNRPALTYYQMGFLLAASVWLNALANGFIAATQSYSSLPYSNMAYNLSVRLSTVANPLACLLALFLPSKSKLGTGVLTLLGSGCAAYQIYLAAMSPEPPLAGTAAGEFLVVSVLLRKGSPCKLELVTNESFVSCVHSSLCQNRFRGATREILALRWSFSFSDFDVCVDDCLLLIRQSFHCDHFAGRRQEGTALVWNFTAGWIFYGRCHRLSACQCVSGVYQCSAVSWHVLKTNFEKCCASLN